MRCSRTFAALCAIIIAGGATAAPSRPLIPDRIFSLADFGAVGDGRSSCTAAFRAALRSIEAAGGGVLRVPAGVYSTGPFALTSKMELRLDQDATILMSDKRAEYREKGNSYESCITAVGCSDLAITGKGRIEGSGFTWWDEYKKESIVGTEGQAGGPPRRPRLVLLSDCKRVLIDGPIFADSPSFHLVPQHCSEVTIRDASFVAPADSPNTDGIDPSGDDFLIVGCSFDVGDDCIAVKPGRYPDSDHSGGYLIEACSFRHGHGLSIGGQTRGGMRGLVARDCSFDGTEVGIRLKSARGSGGLVEDLSYEGLKMIGVATPILVTSYYPEAPKRSLASKGDDLSELAADTPRWRNIRIAKLEASGAQDAALIVGLPEAPVEGLTIESSRIESRHGLSFLQAEGVELIDCTILVADGAELVSRDSTVRRLGAGTEGGAR